MVCFSVTSPASFENVREKWFPEVHHHCPGVPCLIVGTQVDLRDDPTVRDKLAKQRMSPVTKADGEKMARELNAVKYVECSALTQYKLKDVFDEVNPIFSFSFFILLTIHELGIAGAAYVRDQAAKIAKAQKKKGKKQRKNSSDTDSAGSQFAVGKVLVDMFSCCVGYRRRS